MMCGITEYLWYMCVCLCVWMCGGSVVGILWCSFVCLVCCLYLVLYVVSCLVFCVLYLVSCVLYLETAQHGIEDMEEKCKTWAFVTVVLWSSRSSSTKYIPQ